MSLSRPVKFPLLKLPFLCIECVVKNWEDIFDIIFFALISQKTRQIVKQLKIPLNRIRILLSTSKEIELGSSFRQWNFRNGRESESFSDGQYSSKYPLVLQKNAKPLYTSITNHSLESYTVRNEITALKMAMEFLNEVFKCSVENMTIYGSYFPESGDIGVKSTMNLCVNQRSLQPFGYARSQKLNLFLENVEVTHTCTFWGENTNKDFFCDPKLFKCKKLVFWPKSAAWVTRETLLQFEVPQLTFFGSPFSVEDIVSFVTNWFHSDKKKLEYLCIEPCRQISLENFQTAELNPVPFSGRIRIPPIYKKELFVRMDFSVGLEIVRHDGLVATIYVNSGAFLFYIWHDQCATTQY